MKAIITHMASEIQYPTATQARQIENEFYLRYFIFVIDVSTCCVNPYYVNSHGLRNCYAAMDGTDIHARTPTQALAPAYFNGDRFHSFKLHAVVDSRYVLTLSSDRCVSLYRFFMSNCW